MPGRAPPRRPGDTQRGRRKLPEEPARLLSCPKGCSAGKEMPQASGRGRPPPRAHLLPMTQLPACPARLPRFPAPLPEQGRAKSTNKAPPDSPQRPLVTRQAEGRQRARPWQAASGPTSEGRMTTLGAGGCHNEATSSHYWITARLSVTRGWAHSTETHPGQA